MTITKRLLVGGKIRNVDYSAFYDLLALNFPDYTIRIIWDLMAVNSVHSLYALIVKGIE